MSNWNDKFNTWSKGPSNTEDEKCENAINMIKDAIKNSDNLKSRDIEIFLQGSYSNRVNVKQNSDVDIGIAYKSAFFADYPEGTTRETFDNVTSDYTFDEFKNNIEQALVDKFGRDAVTRGNKAFDIKANTYRVEADVAPFLEHRRYRKSGDYISGVQSFSDTGSKVINWPKQHYDNAVKKNSDTGRRYKRITRILKKLKDEMADNGVSEANGIPGFLCECLMWNVPNHYLNQDNYYNDLKSSLAFLYDALGSESSNEWGEVSELKYLFGAHQKWSKEKAQKFILAAWNYVGFN